MSSQRLLHETWTSFSVKHLSAFDGSVWERSRGGHSALQMSAPESASQVGLDSQASALISREPPPDLLPHTLLFPPRPSDSIRFILSPTVSMGYHGFCLAPFWAGEGTLEMSEKIGKGEKRSPCHSSALRPEPFHLGLCINMSEEADQKDAWEASRETWMVKGGHVFMNPLPCHPKCRPHQLPKSCRLPSRSPTPHSFLLQAFNEAGPPAGSLQCLKDNETSAVCFLSAELFCVTALADLAFLSHVCDSLFSQWQWSSSYL